MIRVIRNLRPGKSVALRARPEPRHARPLLDGEFAVVGNPQLAENVCVVENSLIKHVPVAVEFPDEQPR
jgi:hypothetical protein